MKDISTTEPRVIERENGVFSFLKSYIINPLKTGLLGFAAFFTFLVAIKYLGVLIGNQNSFVLDITDVALSGLGFVLLFLIKFLENFQDKETD